MIHDDDSVADDGSTGTAFLSTAPETAQGGGARSAQRAVQRLEQTLALIDLSPTHLHVHTFGAPLGAQVHSRLVQNVLADARVVGIHFDDFVAHIHGIHVALRLEVLKRELVAWDERCSTITVCK